MFTSLLFFVPVFLGTSLPPVDQRNGVKPLAGKWISLPANACASSCAWTTQTKQGPTHETNCSKVLLEVKTPTGYLYESRGMMAHDWEALQELKRLGESKARETQWTSSNNIYAEDLTVCFYTEGRNRKSNLWTFWKLKYSKQQWPGCPSVPVMRK